MIQIPEYVVNVCMDSEYAVELHSVLIKLLEFDFEVKEQREKEFTFAEWNVLSAFCSTLGDKLVRGDSDA